MNKRHLLTGIITAALLTGGSATAVGQDAKDTLSFAFTTSKAKTPAGYTMEAEFPRQRVIDQITLDLPAGTVVNTKAVARCTASQDDINANGVAASCPAASKVGSGKGSAFIGDAATSPTVFDLGLYNTAGGAIVDIKLGGKTAFTAPATIKGRRMVIALGLTPSLKARIVSFDLKVDKAGKASKPYLRTPATCPRSKRTLTASITARENGAGSATTKDTTPCKR